MFLSKVIFLLGNENMFKFSSLIFLILMISACASIVTPKNEQDLMKRSFQYDALLDVNWIDAYQRTKIYFERCYTCNNPYCRQSIVSELDRDKGIGKLRLSSNMMKVDFEKVGENQVKVNYYYFDSAIRVVPNDFSRPFSQIKSHIINPVSRSEIKCPLY